jgi:UDP-N-acetylglucosamine acyltransferase
MSTYIHPLACVDPEATLGDDVRVGPFAVIGAGVEIGDGTEIGASAQIKGPTRIGRHNQIYPQTALGFEPQDLKFRGETVRLEIGDHNVIREFCTMSRGTVNGGGVTRVGSHNLIMAYVHIAHDCQVGDRTVFANLATLAGHVEVGDGATVGAFCTIQQFGRIGAHAYLGAYTVLSKDALPFIKTVGVKAACYGVNVIGLKRKGFDSAQIARLGKAYRLLTRSGLNTRQALARMREELGGHPEVDTFITFIETSKRGVTKAVPRGKGRGVSGDDVEGAEGDEGARGADSADGARGADGAGGDD